MGANDKQYKEWYNRNSSLYESCGHSVDRLITILLDRAGIPYHSINFRLKTESSFLKKCESDKYDDPTSQITDLCGIRIITYTNQDVERIQKLIEKEFEIDAQNSVDKKTTMKADQVGYLSVHYVATLKSARTNLEEYKIYKGLKFEIQLRTLLQHAWAEIEHDRNYKFSGELPGDIKRRFYLVAGTLELLDREFQQLSNDIDVYAQKVRISTEKGDLNSQINTTSLMQYLSKVFAHNKNIDHTLNGGDKEIVAELNGYGLETLADLDSLVQRTKLDVNNWRGNYLSVLRDLMIIDNPDKYFTKAWNRHWTGMKRTSYEALWKCNPKVAQYQNTRYIKHLH